MLICNRGSSKFNKFGLPRFGSFWTQMLISRRSWNWKHSFKKDTQPQKISNVSCNRELCNYRSYYSHYPHFYRFLSTWQLSLWSDLFGYWRTCRYSVAKCMLLNIPHLTHLIQYFKMLDDSQISVCDFIRMCSNVLASVFESVSTKERPFGKDFSLLLNVF